MIGKPGPPGLQGIPGEQGPGGLKGSKGHRSQLVKATRPCWALEEKKDLLVKLERMEIQEPLDSRGPLESMVLLQWEILDQLDQEDQGKKETKVHLVNLDLQDPWAHPGESQVSLTESAQPAMMGQ